MIQVYTIASAFNLSDRTRTEAAPGATILDAGAAVIDAPYVCLAFLDGGKQCFPLREEWATTTLQDGDVLYFVPQVGDPLTIIGVLIGGLIIGVAALSLVPEVPSVGTTPEPDPVFDFTGEKNQTRLNNPVEDAYGRCRLWPSHAARSYNQYYGNDQFLYTLLCIGQGSYDVENIYIEDTLISNFEEVTYQIVQPGESVTLFPENVVTSSEVGVIELYGPNEAEYIGISGPFTANPTATLSYRLEVDIRLPRGLYAVNDEGKLRDRTITADFEYREIDNLGAPVGAGTWLTLVSFSKTLRTNTPQRYTYHKDVADGRYEIRAVRTNNKDESHKAGNTLEWVGMRAFLPVAADYGDVTMLAIRARATNNLNNTSANKINVIATRKLHTSVTAGVMDDAVTSYANRVATRNPVWAFIHLLRATYAGNMAEAYIDLDFLDTEATALDLGIPVTFDWVFERRTTVWEAAKMIAFVARAVPMLNGSVITWVRDVPEALPSFFINPENTVKGSFKLQKRLYDLGEHDGLLVQYRDENTWKSETVLCTTVTGQAGINPKKVTYHGIQDRVNAYDRGLHAWLSESYERTVVTVQTGAEGYIPAYGDTIRIGSDVPKWGQSGFVLAVNGTDLTLSENVIFEAGENHEIALRGSKGQELGPYACVAGASDNQVVITGSVDGAEVNFDYVHEPPYFVFGVVDSVGRVCRIIDLSPSGDGVTIKAVVDDQRRFGDNPAREDPEDPEGDSVPATPDNPTVDAVTVEAVPASTTAVVVSWTPAVGAQSYVFQRSPNGVDWEPSVSVSGTSVEIPVAAEATLYVRVAGVNVGQGPWATWNGSVGIPATIPLDVQNLALQLPFDGPSVAIQWDAAPGAEEYEVKVITDTGAGDVVRITEDVTKLFYILTATALDTASGLARVIDFEVRGKNTLGTSELPATLQVTNTAPATITSQDAIQIGLIGSTESHLVQWSASPDFDISLYRVYASETTGFTPAAGNQIFEGNVLSHIIQRLTTDATYYWRVAAIDVWGDEIAASTERSI